MSEKLKFYTITANINKEPFVIIDVMRAINSNVAYEMFFDKYDIGKEDVISYKIVCCGELRDMGHNPYSLGKCNWWVFEAIKKMPLTSTIKISSVILPVYYSEKSIGEALRVLNRDGYIKHEPINALGERTYYKKGQVNGK